MYAEFIQTCGSPSELLDYYAEREYKWMNAGMKIKKLISANNFIGYVPFTIKMLNHKPYVQVQRMRYNNQLYAIVTHSAINYIFAIHGNESKTRS